MAKQLNGSMKWIVALIGLIITVASVYTSVVLAVGSTEKQVIQNCKDITTHYEEGCKPSIGVRSRLVGDERDIENNREDIVKMDKKLDKILGILMKQPEP